MGNKDELLDLFKAAGIDEVVVGLRDGTIRYPSIEAFVETEVKGSPLEALLDEESYQVLTREAQENLQRFRTDGGEVIMPMDAFIVTAARS